MPDGRRLPSAPPAVRRRLHARGQRRSSTSALPAASSIPRSPAPSLEQTKTGLGPFLVVIDPGPPRQGRDRCHRAAGRELASAATRPPGPWPHKLRKAVVRLDRQPGGPRPGRSRSPPVAAAAPGSPVGGAAGKALVGGPVEAVAASLSPRPPPRLGLGPAVPPDASAAAASRASSPPTSPALPPWPPRLPRHVACSLRATTMQPSARQRLPGRRRRRPPGILDLVSGPASAASGHPPRRGGRAAPPRAPRPGTPFGFNRRTAAFSSHGFARLDRAGRQDQGDHLPRDHRHRA